MVTRSTFPSSPKVNAQRSRASSIELPAGLPEQGGADSRQSLASPASLNPALARTEKVKRKSEPYSPKVLNAKARFNVVARTDVRASEQGLVTRKVVCADYAFQFAAQLGKKRLLMEAFSSAANIEAHFGGKLDAIQAPLFEATAQAHPGSKHLVSSACLGHYLSAVAKTLSAPGEKGRSEANCLLLTHNHAMAMQVERKCKDGVDYFSAKLYDPNRTASYKRVEALNPEDLERVEFSQLLPGPGFANHYSHAPGQPVSMAAVCLEADLRPDMGRSHTVASPQNMHVALVHGVSEDFLAMVQAHEAQGGEALDDLYLLLKANAEGYYFGASNEAGYVEAEADNQVPGFFMALQRGHASTVKEFVRVVVNSNLAEDQKANLLGANVHLSGHSIPGFFSALSRGRTEAVREFIQGVAASDVTNDSKVMLLKSRHSSGIPGLAASLKIGHSETVGAYVQEVMDSTTLTDNEKLELLAAKDGLGRKGLQAIACLDERGAAQAAGAVEAFSRAVRDSGLPAHMQSELLDA